MKKCSTCERALPDEAFPIDNHSQDGLKARCKDCLIDRLDSNNRGDKNNHHMLPWEKVILQHLISLFKSSDIFTTDEAYEKLATTYKRSSFRVCLQDCVNAGRLFRIGKSIYSFSPPPNNGSKLCSKCRLYLPKENFTKDLHCSDELNFWCRKCLYAAHKKHRIKYPYRYWAQATVRGHRISGFQVNLTVRELEVLAASTTACPICDVKLDWGIGSKDEPKKRATSPTIDRIDNAQTLNMQNTWIICEHCNRTKLNRTFREFVDYCTAIAKRFANYSPSLPTAREATTLTLDAPPIMI